MMMIHRHFLCFLCLKIFVRLVPCALASGSSSKNLQLNGLTVLTTAPPSYAPRLQKYLETAGATVLSCPTVDTAFLSDSKDVKILENASKEIESYDYVAFTSRRGVQALFRNSPPALLEALRKKSPQAIALGADAEALVEKGVDRSCILVPEQSTPQGIVELLESRLDPQRSKIRILCPVPKVIGLTEPKVVPDFLKALASLQGVQQVTRLNAYQTRWTGFNRPATNKAMERLRKGDIFAICISSTTEVEGLQKFLKGEDEHLLNDVKVIAHGPVTAEGARLLGLRVDEVSQDSSSFAGMVEAIAKCIK